MNRRAERDAAAALLSEAIARRSFEDFCKRTDSSYIETRHTRMLCQYLQALANGEIRKLMIFMPPRHGKTYHASERFPAFFEGINRGEADIILASYTIDRARASSRKVRGLVREPSWPFPDVALDPDAQSVDEWRTTAGGIVKAAGVGGSMTGFGAHLLAIDDPIKGRAEANSLTQREAQPRVGSCSLRRAGTKTIFPDAFRTRWQPRSGRHFGCQRSPRRTIRSVAR